MSGNRLKEAFGKPFAAVDVNWRLQYVDKQKLAGFAVPYLDARAVSDRLDEVVGQFYWKDSYQPWHSCMMDKKEKASQLCTISVYDDERKEWIAKTDGAEDSDIESVKGGLSDAFKRAAVKWNIGRYLYQFEPVWVKVVQRGGGYIVDPSEQNRLHEMYNRKIKEIFGNASSPTETKKPLNVSADVPVYEVKRVSVQPGESGNNSVIIFARKDKQYKAYLKGVDEQLKAGAKIKNIKVEQKTNSYGQYNMLNGYEMAA